MLFQFVYNDVWLSCLMSRHFLSMFAHNYIMEDMLVIICEKAI